VPIDLSHARCAHARLALALAAALLLAASAGGEGEAPLPEVEADTLDRLHAIGYVDYSREQAAEADSGVVVYDPERSQPGYNLVEYRALYRADLIDARGRVLRSWRHGAGGGWARALLRPDGDLMLVGLDDKGRYMARLGWDGQLRWRRKLLVHHEVAPAPGGRLMSLARRWDRRPEYANRLVRNDGITLFTPEGEPLETRWFYEAARRHPDRFRLKGVKPIQHRGEESIDLFHANALDWMDHPHLARRDPLYAPTNVVVTLRNQDAVWVLDWKSGELVWAWGQGEIDGPHNATVLENGHFLIFDNGRYRGFSRVIELDPLTRTIVWQYRAPDPEDFYTQTLGSAQRLANGNTLIGHSEAGRAFEVTPKGEIVWEFRSPEFDPDGHRAVFIRMVRHEPDLVEALLSGAGTRPARLPPWTLQLLLLVFAALVAFFAWRYRRARPRAG
jgi:hypothetical protein